MVVCFPGLEEVQYEEFQGVTGELLLFVEVFLAASASHGRSNV